MSVDFPAPEGPMIPMSSRWQNFPDRHLRRVLYPGERAAQVQLSRAAVLLGHLGDLRTSMHSARACMCLETVSISITRAIATATVISRMIPDPSPWLAPLISSTEEAHALDHGKDHGNPWVRARSC